MAVRDGIDVLGDRIRGAIGAMAPRERALVAFTVVVVLLVIGWFAQGAMSDAKTKLIRQLAATSQAQIQVDALMAEYTALNTKVTEMDAKLELGRDFQALTWIESVGNEMAITEKVRSVQERGTETTDFYTASKITIRIDDLSLEQVTDFVYRLESSAQAIRVDELRIKTDRKDRNILDLTMEIAVLKPPEGV
jgi:type II secretory pathway component PulM